MKTLIILLAITSVIWSQTYKVESATGEVTYQSNGSESWLILKGGMIVSDQTIISTGENSSVKLKDESTQFTLNQSSAVSVSSIKKMTTDELLLALAMEDMINAPKKTEESSDNTAVYGKKDGEENTLQIITDNFGIKRLNGAVQLAKSGMSESAVISAKEIYRKYPETKSLSSYRIFFADILNDKGLYEEALDEYVDIQKLKLSDEAKADINEKIDDIKMKLLSE